MSNLNDKKFLLLGLVPVLIFGGYLSTIRTGNRSGEQSTLDLESDIQFEQSFTVKETTARLVNTTAVKLNESEETRTHQAEPLDDTFDEIRNVLPAWMIEKGKNLEERTQVLGHPVLRSRSRYQYENGSEIEIEITDMGSGADETIVQALGFDLNLDVNKDESGLKVVQDDGELLTNYEFNYADRSGSLQLLFGERYLVEIQVQDLSEKQLQEILDKEISFDILYKNMAAD